MQLGMVLDSIESMAILLTKNNPNPDIRKTQEPQRKVQSLLDKMMIFANNPK